jgi:hypothetical protein
MLAKEFLVASCHIDEGIFKRIEYAYSTRAQNSSLEKLFEVLGFHEDHFFIDGLLQGTSLSFKNVSVNCWDDYIEITFIVGKAF